MRWASPVAEETPEPADNGRHACPTPAQEPLRNLCRHTIAECPRRPSRPLHPAHHSNGEGALIAPIFQR
eukprot:950286-Lingulodinium_polyedra.AAC.1